MTNARTVYKQVYSQVRQAHFDLAVNFRQVHTMIDGEYVDVVAGYDNQDPTQIQTLVLVKDDEYLDAIQAAVMTYDLATGKVPEVEEDSVVPDPLVDAWLDHLGTD